MVISEWVRVGDRVQVHAANLHAGMHSRSLLVCPSTLNPVAMGGQIAQYGNCSLRSSFKSGIVELESRAFASGRY